MYTCLILQNNILPGTIPAAFPRQCRYPFVGYDITGRRAFFSLSCIGAPVLACVPVLRGISIGCVSAYLYASMGMRGLLANLILFWLPAILQSVFLVLFTDAALDTSTSLFRLNFLEQATGAGTKISRCLRIFVVSSLGMLLAAILEGLLAVIFAPVFLK